MAHEEFTGVMLESPKSDNSNTCKALVVNIRPLYITYVRYLEVRTGSECAENK